MVNKKILLVVPNSRWFGKREWMIASQAVLILTGILKDICELYVIDANGRNMSEDQCLDEMRSLNPKVVMVTASSVEYCKQSHKVAEMAKIISNDITTVIGGVYATTMPNEILEDINIDYVFIGHAEERVNIFVDLLLKDEHEKIKSIFMGLAFRRADGTININRLNKTIADICKLVEPDYSKINLTPYCEYRFKKDYQFTFDGSSASIITSYGCPYNCNFCATKTITGRKIRFRSVESVINEIEFLITEYNVKNFTFLDDCLLFDRERINKILNTIIERKFNIRFKVLNLSVWHVDKELMLLLKAAGCILFVISVESGSERVLKEVIRKPLNRKILPDIIRWGKELDISIVSNWVIGFPSETWQEIRETIKYAEELDCDYVSIHMATPLPETDLYYELKEKGLLPHDFDFRKDNYLGFAESLITTEEFTPLELKVIRAFEWDRINFSSPEKTKKVQELFNISEEELEEHRKNTRRKLGVHI